jgi:hypothetical protein
MKSAFCKGCGGALLGGSRAANCSHCALTHTESGHDISISSALTNDVQILVENGGDEHVGGWGEYEVSCVSYAWIWRKTRAILL